MKCRSGVLVILTAVSITAGCAGPFIKSGSDAEKGIRIGGDDAALTGFIAPVKETYEEENGIQVMMVATKPGKELADLQQERLDAVVSAIPVDELVREAARENVAVHRDPFREIKIGNNRTVVFLNKGIKLKKLTKKQLKEIFTGRITNWKKLGGPNRPIVVVWNPDAGENDAFIREVLHGEQVAKNFHPAVNAEELRNKVLETTGAIGIGPNGLVAPGVRVPKAPTLDSTVVLITKGEPSPRVQKLVDLLRDVEFLP